MESRVLHRDGRETSSPISHQEAVVARLGSRDDGQTAAVIVGTRGARNVYVFAAGSVGSSAMITGNRALLLRSREGAPCSHNPTMRDNKLWASVLWVLVVTGSQFLRNEGGLRSRRLTVVETGSAETLSDGVGGGGSFSVIFNNTKGSANASGFGEGLYITDGSSGVVDDEEPVPEGSTVVFQAVFNGTGKAIAKGNNSQVTEAGAQTVSQVEGGWDGTFFDVYLAEDQGAIQEEEAIAYEDLYGSAYQTKEQEEAAREAERAARDAEKAAAKAAKEAEKNGSVLVETLDPTSNETNATNSSGLVVPIGIFNNASSASQGTSSVLSFTGVTSLVNEEDAASSATAESSGIAAIISSSSAATGNASTDAFMGNMMEGESNSEITIEENGQGAASGAGGGVADSNVSSSNEYTYGTFVEPRATAWTPPSIIASTSP